MPDNLFSNLGNKVQAPAPAQPVAPVKSNNFFGQGLQEAGYTLAGSEPGTANPVKAIFTNAIEFLSRGQFASAKFADALANDGENVLNALYSAGKELIAPTAKLSYSDVIRRFSPEFAKNNPTATGVLGFIGDIALDPTSYLGIGLAGDGLRIGGKVLSAGGLRAVEEAAGRIGASQIGGMALRRGSKEAEQLVASRASEIENLFRGLGVTDADAIQKGARQVAQLETLSDIRRAESAGDDLARDLLGPEIRERAEQRIQRITQLDPTAAKEFLAPTRARVNFYPLTQFAPGVKVAVPFSEKALSLLGVNRLADSIRSLSKLEPVGKAVGLVSRDSGLPEEFIQLRRGLENQLDFLTGEAGQAVNKMIGQVGPDGRKAINEALRDLEERRIMQVAANQGGDLTQGQVASLQQQALSRLKPEERAVVVQMMQTYKGLAELEKRADLLGQSIKSFDPRVYDAIADGTQFRKLREFEVDPLTEMFPGYGLKLENLQAAAKAGATPDLDAFSLLAQRITNSRQKLAIKDFSDSVETLFPGGFNALSPRMKSDITFIGDGLYGRGLTDTTKSVLQVYDKLLAPFRFAATVGKVAFAPKQLFANSNQAAIEAGLKAYRLLDPRVAIDAGLLLATKAGLPETFVPESIRNVLTKSFGGADAALAIRVAGANAIQANAAENFAKDLVIKNVFGETLPGLDVLRWMKEDGIIKGVTEATDRIQRGVEREIVGQGNIAKRVVGGLAQALGAAPGKVEDYGRAMLYINGLRMGMTRQAAAQAVNRALFDYGRGLGEFETRVIRRILPFYSYQRFAVPLVVRSIGEKPGVLAAPSKVYDLVGKIFSGDQLTDSERESLPGFLVDQPNIFRGFDSEGRAVFNPLSNLSPVDVVSLFETRPNGSIDFQATARKTVGAALTPFIKVPLELAAGKQFFSDRAIDDAGKIGNLSEGLAATLPQTVKDLIGWEDRTNPRTGKTATYINPYFAYLASNYLPALRSYIQPLDADKSALEKAMSFFLGVGTTKVDLKQEAARRTKEDFGAVREAVGRIRQAGRQGSKNNMETAQEDMKELLELAQRRQARRAGLIRGVEQ